MDMDGRHFELTVASDAVADAMLLELDEITDGCRKTVADVRLSDNDTRWTFSAYERELPLDVVEWACHRGTPAAETHTRRGLTWHTRFAVRKKSKMPDNWGGKDAADRASYPKR